jgi:hypothetical protein
MVICVDVMIFSRLKNFSKQISRIHTPYHGKIIVSFEI